MTSNISIRKWPLAIAAAALTGLAFGMLGGVQPNVEAAPAQQAVTCDWSNLVRDSRGHYHLAGAYDTDHNIFYFYGGLDQSGDVSNFVGSLDVSDPDPANAKHGATKTAGFERFGAAGAYRGGPGTSVGEDDKGVYFIGGADDEVDGDGEDNVIFFSTKDGKLGSAQQVNPAGSLTERLYAAAAYDPDSDTLWVAGGVKSCPFADRPCRSTNVGTKYMSWDAMTGDASWNSGPGSGGPNSIYGHTMVYDSTGKRLLAFGGTKDGTRNENTVYALDLSNGPGMANTWTNLSTSGTAPRLSFHSASYDSDNNWMVATGGTTTGAQSDRENSNRKTYGLDLGAATPTWVELTGTDEERIGGVGAYAPNHKASLRHGGRSRYKAPPPPPMGELPEPVDQNVTGNSDALICAVVPPTDVPTVAPPTDTPDPAVPTSELPTAVPRPTDAPLGPNVCDIATSKVPNAVIAAAQANPNSVSGAGLRCNPNLPPGPLNPNRNWLSLRTPSLPYHPLFNGLAWKCGCP